MIFDTILQINECGAGEAFTFDITVKDVPTLPVINGDINDCLGSATYNVTNNFDSDNYQLMFKPVRYALNEKFSYETCKGVILLVMVLVEEDASILTLLLLISSTGLYTG